MSQPSRVTATARREATPAEAKALAHPDRLRIIRLTFDEALTNKQLAERLGRNPGTSLYHLRMLVATGFVAAEEPRRGARNASEVPYRSTGKSWTLDVGEPSQDTFSRGRRRVPDRDPRIADRVSSHEPPRPAALDRAARRARRSSASACRRGGRVGLAILMANRGRSSSRCTKGPLAAPPHERVAMRASPSSAASRLSQRPYFLR